MKFKTLFIVCLVLSLTFAVYFLSLKNGFVNWDDQEYVVNNPSIRSFSPSNLGKIFTSFYVSNYQPVTILSYSLDYHFFKLNPFGFHATNLFLHLLNCLLVFLLILRLSNKIFVAFLAAIFFGVHPLHVESVAWVAERKDVLYSFFFLASLFCYIKYILGKKDAKFYYFSLTLFILSCLAKSMAVTLPLLLILLDYFYGRKFNARVIKEKILFFVISGIFSACAVFSQHKALRQDYCFNIFERITLASTALLFYVGKIFLPFKLSALYPYSNVSLGQIPKIYLFSPWLVAIIAGLIIYSVRYSKRLVFGGLFFLVTLLPVIQIIPVGNVLVADRYCYLPAIGVFYILGELFYLPWRMKNLKCGKILKSMVIFILAVLVCAMAILSWQRAKIWNNSLILFDDVLKTNFRSAIPYNNRGLAFLEKKYFSRAISDFRQALVLDPNNPQGYCNLCNAYAIIGKNDEAINLCRQAVERYPNNELAHFNLGNAYANKNRNTEAIASYRKAISLKPDYADAFHNLATVYVSLGEKIEAIKLFKQSLKLNPEFADANYNLAVTYYYDSQYALAIEYCDRAVKLGFIPEKDFLELLKPYRAK